MSERDRGTGDEIEPLPSRMAEEAGGSPERPAPPAAGDQDGATRAPMLAISPKWQMVLIGGAFIAINIMVMVIFLVVIFLRR